MDQSILNSIKQMLGITPEQTDFDADILIHINTVLNILHQLGVCSEWIQIDGPSAVWSDITEDIRKYNMVKTFMYLKVRLLFDPPLNATVINSMEKQLAELEWRLTENFCDKEVVR